MEPRQALITVRPVSAFPVLRRRKYYYNGLLFPLTPTLPYSIAKEFGLPSVGGMVLLLGSEDGPLIPENLLKDTLNSEGLSKCTVFFDIDDESPKGRWFRRFRQGHGTDVEASIQAGHGGQAQGVKLDEGTKAIAQDLPRSDPPPPAPAPAPANTDKNVSESLRSPSLTLSYVSKPLRLSPLISQGDRMSVIDASPVINGGNPSQGWNHPASPTLTALSSVLGNADTPHSTDADTPRSSDAPSFGNLGTPAGLNTPNTDRSTSGAFGLDAGASITGLDLLGREPIASLGLTGGDSTTSLVSTSSLADSVASSPFQLEYAYGSDERGSAGTAAHRTTPHVGLGVYHTNGMERLRSDVVNSGGGAKGFAPRAEYPRDDSRLAPASEGFADAKGGGETSSQRGASNAAENAPSLPTQDFSSSSDSPETDTFQSFGRSTDSFSPLTGIPSEFSPKVAGVLLSGEGQEVLQEEGRTPGISGNSGSSGDSIGNAGLNSDKEQSLPANEGYLPRQRMHSSDGGVQPQTDAELSGRPRSRTEDGAVLGDQCHREDNSAEMDDTRPTSLSYLVTPENSTGGVGYDPEMGSTVISEAPPFSAERVFSPESPQKSPLKKRISLISPKKLKKTWKAFAGRGEPKPMSISAPLSWQAGEGPMAGESAVLSADDDTAYDGHAPVSAPLVPVSSDPFTDARGTMPAMRNIPAKAADAGAAYSAGTTADVGAADNAGMPATRAAVAAVPSFLSHLDDLERALDDLKLNASYTPQRAVPRPNASVRPNVLSMIKESPEYKNLISPVKGTGEVSARETPSKAWGEALMLAGGASPTNEDGPTSEGSPDRFASDSPHVTPPFTHLSRGLGLQLPQAAASTSSLELLPPVRSTSLQFDLLGWGAEVGDGSPRANGWGSGLSAEKSPPRQRSISEGTWMASGRRGPSEARVAWDALLRDGAETRAAEEASEMQTMPDEVQTGAPETQGTPPPVTCLSPPAPLSTAPEKTRKRPAPLMLTSSNSDDLSRLRALGTNGSQVDLTGDLSRLSPGGPMASPGFSATSSAFSDLIAGGGLASASPSAETHSGGASAATGMNATGATSLHSDRGFAPSGSFPSLRSLHSLQSHHSASGSLSHSITGITSALYTDVGDAGAGPGEAQSAGGDPHAATTRGGGESQAPTVIKTSPHTVFASFTKSHSYSGAGPSLFDVGGGRRGGDTRTSETGPRTSETCPDTSAHVSVAATATHLPSPTDYDAAGNRLRGPGVTEFGMHTRSASAFSASHPLSPDVVISPGFPSSHSGASSGGFPPFSAGYPSTTRSSLRSLFSRKAHRRSHSSGRFSVKSVSSNQSTAFDLIAGGDLIGGGMGILEGGALVEFERVLPRHPEALEPQAQRGATKREREGQTGDRGASPEEGSTGLARGKTEPLAFGEEAPPTSPHDAYTWAITTDGTEPTRVDPTERGTSRRHAGEGRGKIHSWVSRSRQNSQAMSERSERREASERGIPAEAGDGEREVDMEAGASADMTRKSEDTASKGRASTEGRASTDSRASEAEVRHAKRVRRVKHSLSLTRTAEPNTANVQNTLLAGNVQNTLLTRNVQNTSFAQNVQSTPPTPNTLYPLPPLSRAPSASSSEDNRSPLTPRARTESQFSPQSSPAPVSAGARKRNFFLPKSRPTSLLGRKSKPRTKMSTSKSASNLSAEIDGLFRDFSELIEPNRASGSSFDGNAKLQPVSDCVAPLDVLGR